MIAQNTQAVMRAQSKIRTSDKKLEKPTWKAVIEHFLALLFDPRMGTVDFDRLENAAFDA